MTPVPGVLIALEGIDGCGKSTQAALLLERLTAAGVPMGPAGAPQVVREPGATALGERVRDILLHESRPVEPWAEALLYAAARAQLAQQVLRPALADGLVIVLDRYVDSSLAYQGWARGLGIDAVFGINMLATERLLPALTIVLRLSVEEALARWGARRDRIEAQGERFQAKVAEGYERVLASFPQRVVAVDAAGDREQIADRIWDLVAPLLAARGYALDAASAENLRAGAAADRAAGAASAPHATAAAAPADRVASTAPADGDSAAAQPIDPPQPGCATPADASRH